MKLILKSDRLEDYLQPVPPYIQWDNPLIQKKIKEIESLAKNDEEKARLAFETARDNIKHSFDTQFPKISIGAEDTLNSQEGICFAKAHLLAALLRGMGIPAGFCYQRVLRKGTVESGYALHGLNAIFLEGKGWFRVDPRGNKPGINAQFTTDFEQLAYPIRPNLGEVDYPFVFARPLKDVLEAMEHSKDTQDLFFKRPEAIINE